MKRVKGSRKKKVEPAGPPLEFAGMLLRFIITIPALLLIFYITLLLASRTDGFLSLMEEQLETYSGLDMTVEKSWMDMGFKLHLADISSFGVGPEGKILPEMKIARMDLEWPGWKLFQGGIRGAQKIEIVGFEAVLVKSNGQWLPILLEKIAPLPRYYSVGDFQGMMSAHYDAVLAPQGGEAVDVSDDAEISEKAPVIPKTLTVEKAKIKWIVNNQSSALLEWKRFTRGQVITDKRVMKHNDLVDGTLLVHNRGGFRDVDVEWLETRDGLTFITEQYIAVQGSGPSISKATERVERKTSKPRLRTASEPLPPPVFTGLPEDEISVEIRNRMREAVESE